MMLAIYDCFFITLTIDCRTVTLFMSSLDKFLEYYPDQLYMEGYRPDTRDICDNSSNSLLDWVKIMGVPLNNSEDTI